VIIRTEAVVRASVRVTPYRMARGPKFCAHQRKVSGCLTSPTNVCREEGFGLSAVARGGRSLKRSTAPWPPNLQLEVDPCLVWLRLQINSMLPDLWLCVNPCLGSVGTGNVIRSREAGSSLV